MEPKSETAALRLQILQLESNLSSLNAECLRKDLLVQEFLQKWNDSSRIVKTLSAAKCPRDGCSADDSGPTSGVGAHDPARPTNDSDHPNTDDPATFHIILSGEPPTAGTAADDNGNADDVLVVAVRPSPSSSDIGDPRESPVISSSAKKEAGEVGGHSRPANATPARDRSTALAISTNSTTTPTQPICIQGFNLEDKPRASPKITPMMATATTTTTLTTTTSATDNVAHDDSDTESILSFRVDEDSSPSHGEDVEEESVPFAQAKGEQAGEQAREQAGEQAREQESAAAAQPKAEPESASAPTGNVNTEKETVPTVAVEKKEQEETWTARIVRDGGKTSAPPPVAAKNNARRRGSESDNNGTRTALEAFIQDSESDIEYGRGARESGRATWKQKRNERVKRSGDREGTESDEDMSSSGELKQRDDDGA